MKTPSNQLGLRENLSTLFRHKNLIIAVALLTAVSSLIVAMLQSRVWESSLRIVVQQNRQSVRVGAGTVGQDAPFGLNRSEQVRTEIEIMSSPVVLSEAVSRLGPELVLQKMRWRWDWLREMPDQLLGGVRRFVFETLLGRPPGEPQTPKQLAIREVSAHLKLEPVREAAVFSVTFESPDPQFSPLLVNTLVEAYLKHHIEVRQAAATSGVFAAETLRLREDLQAATERQQALKASTGIVSVVAQKQLLLQRLSDAEAALQRAAIGATESQRRISEAERQLAQRSRDIKLQSTVARNPAADDLRQQLAQLEIERGNYRPGSAAARTVDNEIASVQARLQGEQERVSTSEVSGVDTTFQEIERNLLAERGRLSALLSQTDLRRQIEAQRAELKQLDSQETILREATRDVDLKEEALRNSLRKQEEERLGGLMNELKVSDVVPIETAVAPDRPSRPHIMLSTLIGLGTGVFAGLGLAFLREYFRRTIVTSEEAAEQLGVRVLASLLDRDRVPGATAMNQIELRRLAETVRQERASAPRGLAILVTSTSPGEGKTLLVRELCAMLGRRENACATVDATNGQLRLPQGLVPPDTLRIDALAIDAARRALGALCEENEVVLIDGPALGSSGDGLWLPEIVDRVILVLQAEGTSGMNARRTLRLVEGAGGQVMGVVLNRRRFVIPGWVYDWLLSPRHAVQAGRAKELDR